MSEPPLAQKVGNPDHSVAHFLSNPEEFTLTRETPADEPRTADNPPMGRPDAGELSGRAENPYVSPLPSDELPQGRPDTQPSPDLDDFIDINF
jgi:hypothetical protein